ncbi:hypothetical protein L596_012325 [Steinernema carpocapsae]|uniref:Uncharacterized protein n=2 Tax=Steinernema carpocapsae TaxID=34508 RepID=A0A4U5NWQ8_STECR|nr:hypothetical protein L596_011653 [Steinernema carpocapsae]TKR88019.1 hypothetical protein L596_012325 [Steinernema carpocapsae]
MDYYNSLPSIPSMTLSVMIPRMENSTKQELVKAAIVNNDFTSVASYCPKLAVFQGNHRITALHQMKADHLIKCRVFDTLSIYEISALEICEDHERAFHLPVGLIDRMIVLTQLLPISMKASQKEEAISKFEKKEQFKKAMTCGIRHFSLDRMKKQLQPLFHMMQEEIYSACRNFHDFLGNEILPTKFPLHRYDMFLKISVAFGDNHIQRMGAQVRNKDQVTHMDSLLTLWNQRIRERPDTCNMFGFESVIKHDNAATRIVAWLEKNAPLKDTGFPDFPVVPPFGSVAAEVTDISVQCGLTRSLHPNSSPRKRRLSKNSSSTTSSTSTVFQLPRDVTEEEWMELFRTKIRDSLPNGTSIKLHIVDRINDASEHDDEELSEHDDLAAGS